MGHFIPVLEFAKRLVVHHNFSATLMVPDYGPQCEIQKAFLESLPSGLNYLRLPPPNFDDLEADIRFETRVAFTIARSLPSIRNVFKSLVDTHNLVAFVVDLFGTDAFDVANEFKVSPYIFFPSTAMTLSLFLYLPKLDKTVSCKYRDLPEPVLIPGCLPIPGKDLVEPVQDRGGFGYKWVLHHVQRYNMAEGIVLNSLNDMEREAIKALQSQEEEAHKPPIYPVGPLVRTGSICSEPIKGSSDCLKWLAVQPPCSILFINFGSLWTLSQAQINEIALGLEMSEKRFLWVVRNPKENNCSGNDPLAFLPEGLIDRTKKQGLLVPYWAPQAHILQHGSTGGFLTHCGWNSVLESVVNGIPMIAWPLGAEQKMNAIILVEDLKVALRPKAGEDELVGRVDIAKTLKNLMEGEEGKQVLSRMTDLKRAANMGLSEGGSSTKSLADLTSKWKDK